MTFSDYPKEIILKDGTGVTLRPIKPGDGELLGMLFNRLSEDDRWFLERDIRNPSAIRSWTDAGTQGKSVSIVAILEGKIIGIATLYRRNYGPKAHIGEIGISVDPEFRGKHLATWMLLDLVNLAMSEGLEILVMYLAENRDSALTGSLKRLGFGAGAVLKNHLKDREGNFHNLVIMVKHLQLGLTS